ncbi:MAG TPA: LuxR C-terminal-related transcriptional regulator [Steroidobacteraceae bacterium]|nr:LuxR C-terminal-related transcriptional regulator [Steroidobacteraceae bacterium]
MATIRPNPIFPPRAAVLTLLGLTAGAPFLLSACSPDAAHAAAAQAPSAPQVSVAEVLERQITNFQELTGRIEAVERVELRPRVSGYIESVAFREGAQGRSNKEIGRRLAITEGTAKTHVKAILTKLDAISRTEAVAVAHKRGLIRL